MRSPARPQKVSLNRDRRPSRPERQSRPRRAFHRIQAPHCRLRLRCRRLPLRVAESSRLPQRAVQIQQIRPRSMRWLPRCMPRALARSRFRRHSLNRRERLRARYRVGRGRAGFERELERSRCKRRNEFLHERADQQPGECEYSVVRRCGEDFRIGRCRHGFRGAGCRA